MTDWKKLKEMLLGASDRQLDDEMKPLIERWDDPPKAIQLLEVIDHCIYGSLASGFVVASLQLLYDARLKEEGITHESLLKDATWRNEE